MAGSRLSELRNMRVLLEETRLLARDLTYHRRAGTRRGRSPDKRATNFVVSSRRSSQNLSRELG
jgi:hypothetical protein